MADLEFIRCSGINEDFIMNCQLLDMEYDLIQNDNRASFEMDCEHRLVTKLEQGSCTLHSRWHIE